jgi:crotonobetainyl-CoA:carnitine CoA-transferase CaiB-like acyl-CoA transferase
MMGFLGADVIKVEPPGVGDPARHFSTVPLEPNVDSFYFIFFNLNKKSITLDLDKAKGREILKEMVKRVDVLVENFEPGTMERWGLTYHDLNALNPGLIYARITGYGSYGPYANYPCLDANAQAMSGSFTFTGWSDKPPVKPAPSIGETGAGVNLFAGIMMALHQKDRTGKGQFVEVSMVDTAINLCRVPMSFRQSETDQMFRGKPAMRTGVPSPGQAPSNIYPTKDNDAYIVFMFGTAQRQWEALLKIIGHPELVGDPRFVDPQARGKVADVVDKLISDWTSTKGGLEAFNALASGGVSTGVTLTSTQAMNDPHVTFRKKVVELTHPVRGKYKTLSYAPVLEKSPVDVQNAPLLGQDNVKVYADLMGYTRDDLAKLKEVGVV